MSDTQDREPAVIPGTFWRSLYRSHKPTFRDAPPAPIRATPSLEPLEHVTAADMRHALQQAILQAAHAVDLAACRDALAAKALECERLRAALTDTRNFVHAELDTRLYSFCVVDRATGKSDISTLDESDGGVVGEAMDCLARIDAALQPDPKPAQEGGQ